MFASWLQLVVLTHIHRVTDSIHTIGSKQLQALNWVLFHSQSLCLFPTSSFCSHLLLSPSSMSPPSLLVPCWHIGSHVVLSVCLLSPSLPASFPAGYSVSTRASRQAGTIYLAHSCCTIQEFQAALLNGHPNPNMGPHYATQKHVWTAFRTSA